jgi:hypothetical protein
MQMKKFRKDNYESRHIRKKNLDNKLKHGSDFESQLKRKLMSKNLHSQKAITVS